MLPEAELRVALATVRPVSIHGPWSRTIEYHLLQDPPPGAPPGSSPQPLWPGGAKLRGARFTPRDSFDTIYLASDEETARREVEAIFRLSDGTLVTVRHQPWVIVSVDGILTRVLDLTDVSVQAQLGTNLSELTGAWLASAAVNQLVPTQLLGKLAHASRRFVAIRYVSSKNPSGYGLAVFANRLVPTGPSWLEVHDPHGHLSQRLPA